jgi:hypothetical protein
MILPKTDHICLRVGRHRWYQSIMGLIHHVRSYFWKPTVRICLDVYIMTMIVLTGGKLTGIYFLHLLSVTTHLRQGKKVSIVPCGWCESRTCPLKMRLTWGQSLSCDRGYVSVMWLVTTVHLGRVDQWVSCGCFLKTWICSRHICSTVHAVLNTWAPLGG